MSKRRPRNILYWPKMKIRGAKRKQKQAQRQVSFTIFWANPQPLLDGRHVFTAAPAGQATHMLQIKQTRDGYGRPVR